MSVFVQETNVALCLWILGSIVLAIALLLLSVFEGKTEELRETVIFPEGSFTATVADAFTTPEDRLQKLERRINTKCAKYEISQGMLEETKRTISELEITSGEVQKKYQELLRQLKTELSKTEKECQHLHDQIENITTKRDKIKQELDEVGLVLKGSRNNCAAAFDDQLKSSKSVLLNIDSMLDFSRRSQLRSSNCDKFKISMEGF
ncbi:hypothetical protein RUM44_012917 [Polyplax serrata]|uniref:Uncharacterized protein n=1 Tax=Polyplax serrata TaxID=468196 RepID=A0ABR1BCP1_POLSC